MANVQATGHLHMCKVSDNNLVIPVFSLHKNVNLLRERSSSLVPKYSKTERVCWRSTGVISGPVNDSAGVKELKEKRKPLRILIAGGGIGGLVLALALKNKGRCFEVKVFEKDLSAVKGEGKHRGPIQIQSNALAALQAIDGGVAEEIMESGCVTGDRVNGLVDGLSGSWYIKFDTFTPAVERGLPVTRVISRMTLQKILVRAIGPEIIENSSNVVDFNDDGQKVTVMLEDGRQYEGDILVGADGIWSKVRTKLFGPKGVIYSQYTCYSGIVDFVPPEINTVAYRVFLGYKQYFVSSDVGSGKMQWYAFHYEPAGSVDPPNGTLNLTHLHQQWKEGFQLHELSVA